MQNIRTVASFSDVPLNLASYLGAGAAALSALGGATLLVLTVVGAISASISLWILVALLFISGVQLMFIGVLGRYLAHVHDQVVGRPLYLVSRVVPGRRGHDAGDAAEARPPARSGV